MDVVSTGSFGGTTSDVVAWRAIRHVGVGVALVGACSPFGALRLRLAPCGARASIRLEVRSWGGRPWVVRAGVRRRKGMSGPGGSSSRGCVRGCGQLMPATSSSVSALRFAPSWLGSLDLVLGGLAAASVPGAVTRPRRARACQPSPPPEPSHFCVGAMLFRVSRANLMVV